jgi:hypothetical protein
MAVIPDLPLRAAYTVAELARVSFIERRRLRRILEEAGVTFLRSGRVHLVSISELEGKVPALWDGIKATYALSGGDQ